VILVRLIPVLLFPVLRFQRPAIVTLPSTARDAVLEMQGAVVVSDDRVMSPLNCEMPDFQHSISVSVTVAVAVSVKTVSVQAVYAVAAGACAR